MENTFKEYNEWFIRNMDGNLEKNFMDSYKDALKYLKEIQKYENGLVSHLYCYRIKLFIPLKFLI